MEIWRSLDEIPKGLTSVVTIGNFDGMHEGHRKVISAAVTDARAMKVQAIACTFDPHPRQVHNPDSPLKLISPLRDRLDAMAAAGLNATFVIHYDESVYTLTPREFVEKYVVDALGAAEVVVGKDFRFGRNNSGDLETLSALGEEFGFTVTSVDDVTAPEGRRWSSSWVRQLLEEGDVSGAARVLGHLHRIRGTVEHGYKRGRELGFPTANLCNDIEGVVPGDGVYAGWLVRHIGESGAAEFLPAAISVGTNPQFDGEVRTVEAHVLGRSDLNLYGENISIMFVSRIRPMESFESLDALLSQMDEDLRISAYVLGVGVPTRVDPKAVTAR